MNRIPQPGFGVTPHQHRNTQNNGSTVGWTLVPVANGDKLHYEVHNLRTQQKVHYKLDGSVVKLAFSTTADDLVKWAENPDRLPSTNYTIH